MKTNTQIAILLMFIITFVPLILAADFVPYGDLNGKGIRRIYNFTSVNATEVWQGAFQVLDTNTTIVATEASSWLGMSVINTSAFTNISSTLGVVQSLWEGLYCQLTGCNMGGNIDAGNNSITNVSSIGIGTTTPQDIVHVIDGTAEVKLGDAGSNYGGIWLSNQTTPAMQSANADSNLYVASQSGANVYIRDGSSTNLYVGNDARIGINTTTPTVSLEIISNVDNTGIILNDSTNWLFRLIKHGGDNSGGLFLYDGGSLETQMTARSGQNSFVGASGNVNFGVGTNSPVSEMQVVGNTTTDFLWVTNPAANCTATNSWRIGGNGFISYCTALDTSPINGTLDSLSWIRSGTNVALANNGDSVIINGTLNMDNNTIININELSAPDGSMIRFGAPAPFTGIDQAITIISNQTLGDGVITHALLDNQGQKIIAAWQSGKNDSGHFNRNSMCVFPDFGLTNASQVTNCEFMFQTAGITPLADYFSAINHTALGVLWALESQKLFLHDGQGNGQLLGEGDFRWISSVADIDFYEAPIHIKDEEVREVGLGAGVATVPFSEDFEKGNLSDFTLITSGKGLDEWAESVDASCPTAGQAGMLCARAGPTGGSGNTTMETNFSSFNQLLGNLTFALNTTDMTFGGDFVVTMNNGNGTEVSLYNLTESNFVGDNVSVTLPGGMDNITTLTMRFYFSSSHATRGEVFVDDIFINGTTQISTLANVTFEDGRINFGDGSCSIQTLGIQGDDNLTIGGANCNVIITNATIQAITSENATGDIEAENLIARQNVTAGDSFIGNINASFIQNAPWNNSGTNVILATTSDSVGIGTTTPDTNLRVNGSAHIGVTGTVAANAVLTLSEIVAGAGNIFITFAEGASDRWSIGNDASPNNAFTISTGDDLTTERFVIDATGNVGINLKDPKQTFNVNGSGNITDDLYVGNDIILGSDGTINTSSGDLIIDAVGVIKVENTLNMVDNTLQGSQSASGKLVLSSTGNAAKGSVRYGSSTGTTYWNETPNDFYFGNNTYTTGDMGIDGGITFGGNVFAQDANGGGLIDEAASATNPIFVPNKGDTDTGIGHAGADNLSLIAGAVEGIRIAEVNNNITATLTGGLVVNQPGAGLDGIDVNINAGLTAGKYGLSVDTNSINGAGLSLVLFRQDNGASAGYTMWLENDGSGGLIQGEVDGTGDGVFINVDGDLAVNKNAINVFSDVAQTNAPLMDIESTHVDSTVRIARFYTNADASASQDVVQFIADNAAFDRPVVTVQQEGTAAALNVPNVPNNIAFSLANNDTIQWTSGVNITGNATCMIIGGSTSFFEVC